MSAFRVYTSSLVPYQDLETEGLTLMIVESGQVNHAMSHPEVRKLRKSVLPCHLLSAYNRCKLSATRLVVFFQIYSRKHMFIASDDNVPQRLTLMCDIVHLQQCSKIDMSTVIWQK